MRDDFSAPTARLLAARVGYKCSNANCRQPTFGPDSAGSGTVNLGVAAHITAAAPGGPRFDASMTSEERQAASNGIWLCQSCAKLVDSDVARFSRETLENWKQRAELAAMRELQSAVALGNPVATLDRILEGHSNYVWDVVVTPDGRRVLSASNDSTVRMWDIASGNRLATFVGHDSFVCSISVSSCGRRLVSGGLDGSVIVFDLASGKAIGRFYHGANDAKVSWGPAAGLLATGGADGAVRVWDAELFTAVADLRVHQGPVLKVLCLDDGDRIVSVSADRTVRICSFSLGKCVRVLEGHTGEVNSVAVCGNRRRAASASGDCTIKIWDLETAVCGATMYGHRDIAWRVAITADGARVASGSADNTVILWDADRALALQELPHPDCVAAVSFSPDGTRLAVGCDDNRVYIYKLLTGSPLAI